MIFFLNLEFSVVRTSGAKSLAEFFRSVYSVNVTFFFGAAANQLITDICKYSIGRLRPHFLSLCNPNLTLDEATCGTPLEPKYITDFACSGSDLFPSEPEYLDRVRDSRLSFLSGHASLSAYSMLFAIIYIQRKLTNRNYRLVKPLIQVGCSLFAIYTSLSRISDYKHHPEDVIGGAVLGSLVAVLAHFISTNSVKQGGEAVEQATSTTTLLNLPVRCVNCKGGSRGATAGSSKTKNPGIPPDKYFL
ncbi:phospholipid phosphatase 1 [Eurytemora carolleeae]|uniref:phospholipid phosphatase 1 n=1 Tax=Eurytemora carolleeae TaxID=1294199 RepID=UPI000C790FE7|nr:phospholipid phosphatase 1 [Eurytemora carolleeae]|eukprot:XP_023339512.1 phospholipid phosphatase 1-like [Eurytemora affinis]